MANIYGAFQAYCNEHGCCDCCNKRVRFWCKVKCRIEERQTKIIKELRRRAK